MEYELSESTRKLLEGRRDAGCFLCRRIMEAMDGRGVLHDWPPGKEGPVEFPIDGQRYHIQKEKEGKA